MATPANPGDAPAGRILSVAPGLPSTDMTRTAGYYRRLGFVFPHPGPPRLTEPASPLVCGTASSCISRSRPRPHRHLGLPRRGRRRPGRRRLPCGGRAAAARAARHRLQDARIRLHRPRRQPAPVRLTPVWQLDQATGHDAAAVAGYGPAASSYPGTAGKSDSTGITGARPPSGRAEPVKTPERSTAQSGWPGEGQTSLVGADLSSRKPREGALHVSMA